MNEKINRLLKNNRAWVEEMTRNDPAYFKRLAKGQTPDYLFIGCSDSRVPANALTGTDPGEMFVHRNIANQFLPHDLNCVAVVQYAVEVLDVQEVLVVGHYGCGGVQAAASANYHGVVDHWLGDLRSLARTYAPLLQPLDARAAHRKLVELSVLQQVVHLSVDPTIRRAWDKGRRPRLTGLVYDLEQGLLEPLVTGVDSGEAAATVLPLVPLVAQSVGTLPG